jgi:tRNA (guanine-N7-)-methyltransferase
MEYNKEMNASNILNVSNYIVKNPTQYKGKWNKYFNNNNPIHIELGMGRGNFIIGMAKAYPKINFIGIELNESQTAYAAGRLVGQNLPNLKMICMNANDLYLVFGKEVDTIYLTFSEPWPKKIDESKRFTHINYLKTYDRIFKKNKHIIMKTDNKGLFAYSLESLSQYWYSFKRVSLDLHHEEEPIPNSNILTDFEANYQKEGNKPIYYVDAVYED